MFRLGTVARWFFPVWLASVALAEDDKRSPFDDLRWLGDTVEVRLGADGWFRLEAIDDLPIADILRYCNENYADEARRRFAEDLVPVLQALGKPPGKTVDLKVRNIQTNNIRVFEDVPMTFEKRQRLWRKGQEAPKPKKVPPHERTITREEAQADLKQLDNRFDAQWSYLKRKPVDLRGEVAKLSASLPETVRVADLAVEITRIIAKAGDGHARVDMFESYLTRGFLPFLVAPAGDKLVAFNMERDAFVDPDHPYLVKLDGRPVADWLAAARPLVSAGSDALVRHRSVRMLRLVNFLREQMGLPVSDVVSVTLANAGGDEMVKRLPIVSGKQIYGSWPRRAVERMGEVGYLRIPKMDRSAPQTIASAFEGLDTTKAMIIDVRGNPGGGREPLATIWPLLVAPDAAPVVVNLGQYRLAQRFRTTHLEKRSMYLPEHRRWREDDVAAMDAFLADFKPAWRPPAIEFSPWHFMVLRGRGEAPRHYTNPVVVLVDEGCFSATDVFVAALKQLPHVTLLGLPTSGGSGFARPGRLSNSGIDVYLSSMVSYQPDGKLYDGNGIAPDVEVDRTAGYYIGREDPQLDAALKYLNDKISVERANAGG